MNNYTMELKYKMIKKLNSLTQLFLILIFF